MAKKSKDEGAMRRDKTMQAAPRDPLARLRGEIEQLFDTLSWPGFALPMYGSPAMPSAARSRIPAWSAFPAMDLVERNGGFELSVELPGMEPDDIDIRLTDSTLTVRGKREEESTEDEGDYHLSERCYGTIERTIGLPTGIDADLVSADFNKGVLKVILPKSKEAKAAERKIEVKAA
ncbi:MAG: Hsp20/alpha crystallin family protein [Paracoccaceae bacterium]